MKISPGQAQAVAVDPSGTSASQVKPERASTQVPAPNTSVVEKTKPAESANNVAPLERQTDVTYKQDSNGRVYYSVSDAKSGQEILEVPPKALRDVSQGIEDYVKEEQSKASAHVKVKA